MDNKRVTFEDVEKALKERTGEVINDIQHLLEGVCANICKDCEFQYLCIRNDE